MYREGDRRTPVRWQSTGRLIGYLVDVQRVVDGPDDSEPATNVVDLSAYRTERNEWFGDDAA